MARAPSPRSVLAAFGLALLVSPAAAQGQEDLRLLGVFLSPNSAAPGGTFGITGNIISQGIYVGPVTFRVDLSGLGTIHTFARSLTGVGTVDTFSTSVTLPANATATSYNVSITVDSDQLIPESNENNNVFAIAQPLLVLEPDLTISVNGAPTTLAGQPYRVDLTVSNVGQAPAGGFSYRVYLGSGTGGTRLVQSVPLSLGPGQSLTSQELLTLSGAGPTTLTFTVNDDLVVFETRLTNNIRTITTVVVNPQPDLQASLAPTNGFAEVGEVLRLSANLQNTGEVGIDPVTYGYYLSFDPLITTQDRLLATVVDPRTIAPGSFIPVQDDVQIALDVTPGNYWLGVIADPQDQIPELDETNNASEGALLQVVAPELLILNDSVPDGTVGVPYQHQLFAQGGAFPATFSVVQGQLPPGINLSAEGALSGVPTTEGASTFTVRATSGSATAERTFTLTVQDPMGDLQLLVDLPLGFVGLPYGGSLGATGGTPPYRFAVVRGPTWLVLDASGALSGVPTEAGVFELLVEASDAANHVARAGLVIEVRDAAADLRIVQADLPSAIQGQEYCAAGIVRFAAQGGQPPLRWSAASPPPPGLSLALDGALCGTPTQVGEFSFVVEVRDDSGALDSARVPLTVAASGTLTVSPASLPAATLGQAYEATLTASGGQAPYAWMVGSGELPPGIGLESTGALRGAPTTQGTFAFALTVADATGASRTLPYSIRVVAAGAGLSDVADAGCGCRHSAPGPGAAMWALLPLALWARRRR